MIFTEIQLAQLPFWNQLDTAQRKDFLSSTAHLDLKQGCSVPKEQLDNCGVIILFEGTLHIIISTIEGEENVSTYLSGFDCFLTSELSVTEFKTVTNRVTASTPASFLLIPKSTLLSLSYRNHEMQVFLDQLYAKRMNAIVESMNITLFLPLDKRIVYLLLKESEASHSNIIYVTQDKLSKQAYSSREAVNRVLNKFAKMNLLSLKRGQIRIINPDKLNDHLSPEYHSDSLPTERGKAED